MVLKEIKLIVTALLLSVSCALVSVHAEPFETIVNNGDPQNRLDIAVLGDGYTQAELPKYRTDTQNMIQGFFAQQPFLEYQRYFNVHRIDVVSAQSGADHPERSFFVNTAFDATYNCGGIQRLICVNIAKVQTVFENSLSLAQHDMIFVIVNDPEYGGSGGGVAVTSTHSGVIETILHEEGHTLGFLADEYGGPPPPNCDISFEPGSVNATRETARALIKWKAWIDPTTPIPTTTSDPGVPGLYQGASYCDAGLYRPTFASKMRTIGAPFEQINSEQLIKRIYNYVSPLDSKSPAADTLLLPRGQSQNFSVTTPAPTSHSLNVSWYLDGALQTSGFSFNFDSGSFAYGAHTLEARLSDPTAMVRSDPDQVLRTTTSWSIRVNSTVPLKLDAVSYSRNEGDLTATVTVSRTDAPNAVWIDYATSDSAGASDCTATNGSASSRCDYLTTMGTLLLAFNETSKTITIPIVDDSYAEGNETFTLTLSNPVGAPLGSPATATITIGDNETVNGTNQIGASAFFVRQHYFDFLNREPDPSGLNFWVGEIENCTPKPQCTELKRINVSAAFFLSIEFQETGYLVYRLYKAGYGEIPNTGVPILLSEFQRDTPHVSQGVQVGVGNWQAQLESNTVAFTQEFVARSRFTSAYGSNISPAEFVGLLFLNAEVSPTPAERNAAIAEFLGAANTADLAARARALRRVAENPILKQQQSNKAFVLMQYFGYLRRYPNDPPEPTLDFQGYNFWLAKLNQFGGNFVNAEMVKAFILSGEYRHRFGP